MAEKPVIILDNYVKERNLVLPTKSWKQRRTSAIKQIVLHCTDVDWTIEDLWQYDVGGFNSKLGYNHIDPDGLPGISYHEVFMSDGLRVHCNEWEDIVWHAAGHNTNSLGAALMYRATPPRPDLQTDLSPTHAQLSNFYLWAAAASLCLGLDPSKAVVGHRELKGTGWFFDKKGHRRLRKRCPGLAIDLNNVRYQVARSAQVILRNTTDAALVPDGQWGPKTRRTAAVFLHTRSHSPIENLIANG